jgi:CBS domain-containing protein
METGRRMITLKVFRELKVTSVSEIASRTGRTIQNISNAIEELEGEKLVECMGERKRSWRIYKLTDRGAEVLKTIDREFTSNRVRAIAVELEMRLVQDAYRLIVSDPIKVRQKAKIGDVVAQLLDEPRTRTAYLVDGRDKLEGTITLQQLLTLILKDVDLSKHDGLLGPNSGQITFDDPVWSLSNKPITVKPDDSLTSALRKMSKHQLEDIAVVDAKGRLLGELNGMEILTLLKDLPYYKKKNYKPLDEDDRKGAWRK